MVVVKGSTNIAAEIFVAALGNLISVRVPKVPPTFPYPSNDLVILML